MVFGYDGWFIVLASTSVPFAVRVLSVGLFVMVGSEAVVLGY